MAAVFRFRINLYKFENAADLILTYSKFVEFVFNLSTGKNFRMIYAWGLKRFCSWMVGGEDENRSGGK